jgi:alpha-tubulin suppressor-like RCC1 family protein
VAGCKDGTGNPGPEYPPRGQIVSGDLQQGTVGTELATALVVKVTDQDGEPLKGQTVSFAVTAGGGTLFAATATTNAAGEASNRWTLGTVASDTQRVEARMIDPETGAPTVLAVFRAVGVPGAPATITARPPVARTGSAGQALADSLQALVRDQYGNPVPGATVAWLVGPGGGSVSPTTTTTGPDGVARAQWTLGLQTGAAQTADAMLSPAVRAQFTATATVPVGASLVKISGDGQTGTVGAALPQPPTVELRTSLGQPIAGAQVTWTPATFSGTVTPPVSVTGPDGRASTTWTMATTPGLHQLTAATPGVADALFSATAQPGAPTQLEALGSGQVAPPNAPLAQAVQLIVRDPYGNRVPGVAVAWSVTGGGGSITPATSQTDASGTAQAQWTLGPATGTQTAKATVAGVGEAAFSATGQVGAVDHVEVTPAAATFNSISGSQQLTARAVDAYGNTVTDAVVTWTSTQESVATVTSTGLVRPVANGTAEIRASAGGKVGTAAVTVQQVPASVVIEGGTQLMVTDTLHLRATVRDGAGVLMPGAPVTWSTSDAARATVSSTGIVTAVNGPSAVITATASNGVSDTHAVTITSAFVADSLVVGTHNGCGLVGTQAWCWGSNTGYQLAFTGATTSNVPRQIAGRSFVTLTAGSNSRGSESNSYLCGIEANGDAYCWGTHDTGQLGFNDGPRDPAVEPPPGASWCRLSAESGTICYPNPMKTAGGGWAQIDAGDDHTCAINTAGAAYCWGRSDTGQLGGTATPETCYRVAGGSPADVPCVLTPAPVSGGRTYIKVSAGDAYTCALATGGAAYCWGRNNLGQLGNGSTTTATAPVAVAGGAAYARLSAGRRHACAVTTGGGLRCWGDNAAGQLGIGVAGGSRTSPVTVAAPGDGSAWARVAAGDNQTCAVSTAGRVYCWGANAAGQLGDGTTTARTSPTAVVSDRLFADVGAGNNFSCGRTTTGIVYCWGTNHSGRLGVGETTATRYTTPQLVRGN